MRPSPEDEIEENGQLLQGARIMMRLVFLVVALAVLVVVVIGVVVLVVFLTRDKKGRSPEDKD